MLKEMKIGLQLYTMRNHTRTEEDAMETIRRISAMGYRAIQVQPDCCALSLEKTARFAGDLGMEVCATHVGYDWILQQTGEVIRVHREIGCNVIGIGEMPKRFWGSAEGFSSFAAGCGKAAREIRESGLHLVYHNHHFEFLKYGGKLGMDILLDGFDPAMDFELDTYWVQAGGADPMMWIRKLAGRLPVVHLKDMALNEKWAPVFAPVGEGNLNWRGILDACHESGVSWGVVEQDLCAGSEFDSVSASLAFLRTQFRAP
jgi:sugar phosphate isomerase/epimerase